MAVVAVGFSRTRAYVTMAHAQFIAMSRRFRTGLAVRRAAAAEFSLDRVQSLVRLNTEVMFARISRKRDHAMMITAPRHVKCIHGALGASALSHAVVDSKCVLVAY